MSAAADLEVFARANSGTAIPVGTILWLAVKPLIRLLICLLFGVILTKRNLFPASAARTIGQILINVCFPCLLFAKIVPAFNSSNIHFVGPLALLAILYHVIGIAIAWSIKQFCWVPHGFRHGFLAAGAWSNIGDIPTAVLLGLTSSPPFNSSTDPNSAIAYLSVFLIVFNITLFSCGGYRLVVMDHQGPEIEPEQDRTLTQKKTKNIFRRLRGFRGTTSLGSIRPDPEHVYQTAEEAIIVDHKTDPVPPSPDVDEEDRATKNAEITENDQEKVVPLSATPPKLKCCTEIENRAPIADEITEVTPYSPNSLLKAHSPTPTIIDVVDSKQYQKKHTNDPERPQTTNSTSSSSLTLKSQATRFLKKFAFLVEPVFKSLLSPPSLSILISIPISLILPLKALFLPLNGTHIVMPTLPDGQPPLSFLLDTAQFIGSAAVPLGLICLGSALARLRLPAPPNSSTSLHRSSNLIHTLKNLPLTSITLLAVSKLVIVPIIGMLLVQSLVSHNIIPKDDKVLRLVCLICACLPTSTTQVYLTQIYSGTGKTEWLAAYLVPQYVLMVVTMSIYVGLVLKVLFG